MPISSMNRTSGHEGIHGFQVYQVFFKLSQSFFKVFFKLTKNAVFLRLHVESGVLPRLWATNWLAVEVRNRSSKINNVLWIENWQTAGLEQLDFWTINPNAWIDLGLEVTPSVDRLIHDGLLYGDFASETKPTNRLLRLLKVRLIIAQPYPIRYFPHDFPENTKQKVIKLSKQGLFN